MAELPSFFNKADFYGKLLPGYITVILSLALFSPDLVVSRDQAISFDIFSAVVFLVAGPAVGFTLQVFHRYLYTIRSIITKDNQNRAAEVRQYAALRIAAMMREWSWMLLKQLMILACPQQ
jgi:hypothetical protein